MLKSYFLIGLRNLRKQGPYSVIKVAGLAMGLAASIVIYLYVLEDLAYDKFHPHYERIVRVLTIDQAEGVSSKLVGVTPPAMAPAAESEIPEIEKAVRLFGSGRLDLSYEDNLLKCDAAIRTESSFFEVFGFQVLAGKKEKILDEPNTIAITPKLAKRLFGNADPVDKIIKLNQSTDLRVVALVAEPPPTSHIQFDLLRAITPGQNEDGFKQYLQTWQGIGTFTYLLLDQKSDLQNLDGKLQALSKKHDGVEYFVPITQRLADVHLQSKEILFESNSNKSDMMNVYVLSTISFLILLLACVNFINLVTARSATRAKEVGMRKVIGAVRKQLVIQHLTESLLITFASFLLALVLVFAVVPVLNNTYQRFADPMLLLTPLNLMLMAGLAGAVGLLAGSYPAFILSAFKPIHVLKGSFQSSHQGTTLRKALVILQFTISIALMAGTVIVYQQMSFIYNANLGYDRDQVITFALNNRIVGKAATLRDEFLRNPGVTSVGTASSRLGQQLGRTGINPEGFSTDANIITSIMVADEHFIPTMGMEMVSGRAFSIDFEDSLSMMINEEMARLLKWNEPVGKKIGLQSGPNPTDQTLYTVIGVIKDFHFATLRHKLEPLFVLYGENNGSMAVKIKPEGMKETLAGLEATWKSVMAGTTFEYAFLDDEFARLYSNEQAFATMATHFTILAIVIAMLGLFGLSAFTAEQRKKEISIRKVLGAGNVSLFRSLSGEFTLLVLIAFVLASGISHYFMSAWLRGFQYGIEINLMVFAAAGGIAVAVALLTVSYHAIKAILANPVNALRSE